MSFNVTKYIKKRNELEYSAFGVKSVSQQIEEIKLRDIVTIGDLIALLKIHKKEEFRVP